MCTDIHSINGQTFQIVSGVTMSMSVRNGCCVTRGILHKQCPLHITEYQNRRGVTVRL